jgi:hypothetical protein
MDVSKEPLAAEREYCRLKLAQSVSNEPWVPVHLNYFAKAFLYCSIDDVETLLPALRTFMQKYPVRKPLITG